MHETEGGAWTIGIAQTHSDRSKLGDRSIISDGLNTSRRTNSLMIPLRGRKVQDMGHMAGGGFGQYQVVLI